MGEWLLLGFGAGLVGYAACIGMLLVTGRRGGARALAGFVPDCAVLVRRLLGDPLIPRRRKLVLGAAVAYLAVPFDLVPDFIPVAGQLDDAIVVGLVLRYIVRGAARSRLREHWPGPDSSFDVVARLAGARA